MHSATVSSLATVALIVGGPESPLFGITGVFAAIVMYDSLGVRRSAGEQARTLNHLIDDLMQAGTIRSHTRYQHLREILGHRPLEVVIGAIMGVLLAAAFTANSVLQRLPWLTARPDGVVVGFEVGLVLFLIVAAVCTAVLSRRPAGRFARYRPFANHIAISNLIIALAIGFCVLVQRQQIAGWSSWFTLLVTLKVFVLWHLGLWYHLLVDGALRTPVASESVSRKTRWMKSSANRAKKRRAKRAK